MTYQWYSNTTNSNSGGEEISGETDPAYTPSVSTVGTMYYYVVVHSSCGSDVTSNVSSVIVTANTSISVQPAASTSVCAGGTAPELSVTASGTGTVTYQWYSNTSNSNTGGTSITDATSSTYTPSVSSVGTMYYYVVVHSSCGSNVTSDVSSVEIGRAHV